MALSYIVTGAAIIKTGTGSAGALETLGYSEDGVRIEFTKYKGELKSDVAGRMAPAELYEQGEIAWIRAKLTSMDMTVLEKIRRVGGAAGEGDAAAIGRLSGTNIVAGTAFDAYRLLIHTTTDPYNFLTATLRDRQGVRLSTDPYQPELSWFAWAFIPGTATTTSGVDLYNRTTS